MLVNTFAQPPPPLRACLTRHSMLILSAQTSFLHLVHAYLFREKLEIHIVLHQLASAPAEPTCQFFFHEFFFNAYLKAAEGGPKKSTACLALLVPWADPASLLQSSAGTIRGIFFPRKTPKNEARPQKKFLNWQVRGGVPTSFEKKNWKQGQIVFCLVWVHNYVLKRTNPNSADFLTFR